MTIKRKEEDFTILSKKFLLWIVVIAIVVKILGMLILQSWEYESNRRYAFRDGEIGAALAAGLGFSWPHNSSFNPDKPPEQTAWQPPVYPLIIGAVFKVFGIYSTSSALILTIIQIIASALGCVLLFFIGRRVFNMWVGVSAALIFALYPSAMHLTVQKIGSSNLYVVLLLLCIFQFFKLAENPTMKKSILAGITFGFAALTDPNIGAFFLFALGWLFFRQRAELKTRLISIALVFLALCAIILPWEIRNYLVFDRLFFIKSNFTRELFMGNYGNNESLIEESQYKAVLDEGERSKLYQEKILDSIAKDPGRLIRKTFRRFVSYWSSLPVIQTEREKKAGVKEFVAGISYLAVLVLGIAGLCLTLFRSREIQLLVIAILSLPIPFYLIWFTHFRYRFPVEPILMIFASYAIYKFWRLVKAKRP